MGFQISTIQVTGKIGDLIGYEVDGEVRVRRAAKNYRRTEKTKKAAKEFGIASMAGRLIRKGLAAFISKMSDKKFTNRLNKKLLEVIRTGPGEEGNRQVADGDLSLLNNLQLSSYTKFDKLFIVKPVIYVDEMGTLNVTLPECEMAAVMQHRPANTLKAYIKVIICTLDFATGNGKLATADDLIIDLRDPVLYESSVELPLDVMEPRVIVTAIALFFKGDQYFSGDRNFFAAEILNAFLMHDGKVVPFIYPEKIPPPDTEAGKTTQRLAWKIKKPPSGDTKLPPQTP